MEHARLAPSSMGRIVACPGSVQLIESLPEPLRTDEQQEGDAAHWVAYRMAEGLGTPEEGSLAPNGVAVDAEMIEGGELWCETVGMYGVSETPVVCSRIHPTENWGRSDRYRYDPIEGTLRNWDYKYGHRFVEIFEHMQSINYILAEVETLGLPENTRAIMTVVQPRSYHPHGPVRSWEVDSVVDLRAYANKMKNAGSEALGDNPRTRTSEHCLDCPARHACPTLQEAGSTMLEFIRDSAVANPLPREMGRELTLLYLARDLVKARITGLEEQVKSSLRTGSRVPGWVLEASKGKLTWTVPNEEVFQLGDMLNINLRKASLPITPTQAKKVGIKEEVLKDYAVRVGGGAALVQETNLEARRAFGANKV